MTECNAVHGPDEPESPHPAQDGSVPLGWHRLRGWVAARRQAEDHFYASLDLSTGELP